MSIKERPILFSTLMVQAILEDRKDQTRRLTDLGEVNENPDKWRLSNELSVDDKGRLCFLFQSGYSIKIPCPYGKVGDALWVRETWTRYDIWMPGPKGYGKILYKASDELGKYPRWKPCIHMPKTACRIFLEITNIRIERLQDISQEDSQAEGVFQAPHRCPGWKDELNGFKDCYICSYKFLWNTINAESGQGWEVNPWVWVIEFKKIEKPV